MSTTEEESPVTIVSLQSENVKRLNAIAIKPDGSLIVIAGGNGQGKTSVLDSIMYALGGGKTIPERPLRDGAKKGIVKLTLTNGLVVTRTFTEAGGGSLRVEQGGGIKTSPQKILDSLVGPISFDPLEFSRMDAKAQLRTLSQLLGLDFDSLDSERAGHYANRTVVNRDVQRLDGSLASMPEHAEIDLAVAEPTIEEATKALSDAQERNACFTDLQRELAEYQAEIETAEANIFRLRGLKNECEISLGHAENPADIAALEDEVSNVANIRDAYAGKRLRVEAEAELGEANRASEALSEKIDGLDKSRHNQIANAKYPIDGLGINDEYVHLRKIPFDQLASSEQLKISVAIGLAMNPKLRVLLIRDGSLLDEASLAEVARMAKEAKAQVWIERVGDGDEGAIVIEDGAVRKAAEAVPA